MARAIILAAGMGSRLSPYTDDRPKCLVEIFGRSLLEHQLQTLRASGIEDITVVGGYLNEKLKGFGEKVIVNENYETSNMVRSLFCASSLFDGCDDVIICYSDIIYQPDVLKALLSTEGGLVVAADRAWRQLWQLRMENYFEDVESFRLSESGLIAELGQKVEDERNIEAQYVGLIKVSKSTHQDFVKCINDLEKDNISFDKLYMTDLLQLLISSGWNAHPAFIDGGWIEVDTVSDLENYEKAHVDGRLSGIFDPFRKTPVEPPSELVLQSASNQSDNINITDLAMEVYAGKLKPNPKLYIVSRKIEIAGVLCQTYVKTSEGMLSGEKICDEDQALFFLQALVHAYDEYADLRFLNTVVKAITGTLTKPNLVSQIKLKALCDERVIQIGRS